MSRPLRDYAADEADMRASFRVMMATSPSAYPEGIVVATQIPKRIAFRVWILREGGGVRAIDLWSDARAVTVGQLQRAVLAAPYDDAAQLAELARVSAEAKAILKRL